VFENLSADSIYYFDMGTEKYISLTDMKYNAVPVTDPSLRPWVKDLHKIGVMLAKLLT